MTRLTTLVGIPTVLVTIGLAGCGSSSSSGVASGSDFCTSAKNVKSTFDTLGNSFGTTPSLAQVKSAIQAAASSLDSFDSSAPGDISADTHKLRSALDGANTQVQAAGDLNAATGALTALSTPDYNATGDRVDAYLKSHCGFTINSSSSASGSSAGSSSAGTDTGSSTTTTDTASSSSMP